MPYLDKSKHVLRSRELKARNRLAGVCVQCGKTKPAQPSRFQLNLGEPCWTCAECSRAHAKVLRERHAENLAAGKCGQCGKNPLETKTLCHDCRERVKEYAREIRLYLISVGRCTSCRKPNDSHTTRCGVCNEKHNAAKRVRCGSNDQAQRLATEASTERKGDNKNE